MNYNNFNLLFFKTKVIKIHDSFQISGVAPLQLMRPSDIIITFTSLWETVCAFACLELNVQVE